MKYLVSCDIFGMHYQFLRNGNTKKKTLAGFLLTFIYLIIVVALFLGFGIDLYTRKNPKVSFNSLAQPYREKNLTNNQFIYAYRIEDAFGIEIRDDSIIKLRLMNFKYKLIEGKWEILKSEWDVDKSRCSDIPGISFKEKYYNISLKNWFCINFENQTMGGNWDGDFVNFFSVSTELCVNTTSNNNTCKSPETINKKFRSEISFSPNLFFSYLYMEAMPTLDDYDEPIKTTLINRYEMLDKKIVKKHIQIFKESSVNDDRGWIFSDIDIKSVHASDILLNDLTFKDDEDSILFAYYMYFGKKYENYNRTYMKVQEVIASIGGFSKFFHLIVSIFYNHISNILKNFDLIESNYNKYISNLNIQSDDKKLEFSNTSKIELNLTKINNININVHKKKELDLNLLISYKICCKKISTLSKEQKMMLSEYETINKYHNHKLDVITYLNLSKEFDLLKKLLLDDTQQKALELISLNYKIDEPVNVDLFLPKFEEYIKSGNITSEVNRRLFSIIKLEEVKYNNLINDIKK